MSDTDGIWEEMLQAARAVRRPREISPRVEAGGVGAAVQSESGRIYTGVCVDTASSLGTCAERAAILGLISAGENEVRRVVAVMPDGKAGPPCGACRELIGQLMPGRFEKVEFLVDSDDFRVMTLAQLLPDWWT